MRANAAWILRVWSFASLALSLVLTLTWVLPAGAQRAAAVVIDGSIAVDGQLGLDFGLVTPGSVNTVAFTSNSAGRFRVTGTRGAEVQLVFLLPSLLTVGPNNMPISFGPSSAGHYFFNFPSLATAFDPNVGTVAKLRAFGAGQLFVWLGGTVTLAPAQPPGLYTGSVTLVSSYTGN